MAREFGPVNVEIWADPEWRGLPPAAQHLYLLLWTSPGLSYCGVHDWRPNRIAKLSHGYTAEQVQLVADCLVARHFLVVDAETDEVLVRSWARFDGLIKKPRMAVSYASAYAAVASPMLRSVLVHEAQKMRSLWPELACWGDKRVSSILEHPELDAKALPVPSDPFATQFAGQLALGLPSVCDEFVANGSKGLPPVYDPPTPAPAPTPYSLGGAPSEDSTGNEVEETPAEPAPTPEKKATKKAAPKRRLPEDFRPNDAHIRLADELGVDLRAEFEKFVDHWRSKGETRADWDATLRNWIRNSTKYAGGNVHPMRRASGEGPDDWMRRRL